MNIPIQVVVHRGEDGKLWAKAPALPGCATEGATMDELKANIREAIEGWLGVGADVRPDPDDGEVVEVLTF